MKITKGLSCPLCCESHFPDVNELRNSLINVTTKRLPCPVCGEEVSGLDKFTIHLFTHCDITTLSTTPNGITITTTDQQQHCLLDTDFCTVSVAVDTLSKPIIEEIIPEEIDKSTVTPEMTIVNIVENTEVRCDICNISFSDANILEMHRNLLHTNGFSCHLCHKRFKMQGSLMVHMRVAHYGFGSSSKQAQENANQTITDDSKGNKMNGNDNKQWECEVCLKRFTTKYFLKKHKRLHTGEMPYVCSLCNKSFTFQQSYHKHMLYHSADKPHTCSECGRAFKELSTLHNHQRIHSGERPFACETCGKCFRQRVSYLVHRRIHTGAMPYKCTSCDKRFRYKVSQRTHKCKAQPPGAVVRQFGDLVQRLLNKTTTQQQPQETEDIIPVSTSGNTDEDFFNLESLCVSSSSYDNTSQQYSTVNEECFKQLLYDTGNMSTS